MPVYEIKQFGGGISDYEDKGIPGSFKFGSGLDVRKPVDSLSCNQALVDEGLNEYSISPSASASPSASQSPSGSPSPTPSPSLSVSPSATPSISPSPSSGISVSVSPSPSVSVSLSPSTTASASVSKSPSPSGGLTSIFDDLIVVFVKATDGYTYGFGNTGSVYRRDHDGGWIRVYKDPDGGISGAYEWYDSDLNPYLHFATATKVKRKALPGLANWNDVTTIAGNLNGSVPHTMRETGGSLQIANGSFLALVGFDGSYTNEALDLVPGNVANTIVERNGRAITGTYRAADPNKGVNAAIDAEFPLAQIGDDGELFFANMTDTVPFKRFPGGGKVNPGGVCNEIDQSYFFEWEQTALSWIDKQGVGNMSLWGVYGAESGKNGIWSIGRKNKNKPFVMNLEHAMDVDEIGAVCVVEGIRIASYQDGSQFGVMATDTNNKGIGIYEGLDFKTPIKNAEKPTNWKWVELMMKPLPANCSIEFWFKKDKTGDFIHAFVANGVQDFSKQNAKKATFRVSADCDIYEPRLVLNPHANTCPEVYRVRTYFA